MALVLYRASFNVEFWLFSPGDSPSASGGSKVVNGEKVLAAAAEGSGDERDDAIVEPEPEQAFYDRSKSFFDKISCESLDRSKG